MHRHMYKVITEDNQKFLVETMWHDTEIEAIKRVESHFTDESGMEIDMVERIYDQDQFEKEVMGDVHILTLEDNR